MRSTLKRIVKGAFILGWTLVFFGLVTAGATWIFIKNAIVGEVVAVPELYNLEVSEAMRQTKRLGLGLQVDNSQKVHSEVIGEDRILLQVPQPGKNLKKGRVIEVTLSAGSPDRRLPDLKGKPLTFAELLLDSVGSQVKTVTRAPIQDVEPGQIVDQLPKEGTPANKESGVSVLISEGRQALWYVTPDFKSKHYLQVKNLLERHQFRVVTKFKNVHEGAGPIIITQTPKAGFPLKEGATVILEVNKE